jgi:hypothetical protein
LTRHVNQPTQTTLAPNKKCRNHPNRRDTRFPSRLSRTSHPDCRATHIAPTCDFFAFIDDDEIPDPNWLEQLLLTQARTGADVVRGCVEPILPDGSPTWIKDGHFFGWPRSHPDTGKSLLDE